MQITIESTDEIVSLDGVQCRMWKGTTTSGIEVLLAVHRLLVPNEAQQAEFERELLEQDVPQIVQFPIGPNAVATELAFALNASLAFCECCDGGICDECDGEGCDDNGINCICCGGNGRCPDCEGTGMASMDD